MASHVESSVLFLEWVGSLVLECYICIDKTWVPGFVLPVSPTYCVPQVEQRIKYTHFLKVDPVSCSVLTMRFLWQSKLPFPSVMKSFLQVFFRWAASTPPVHNFVSSIGILRWLTSQALLVASPPSHRIIDFTVVATMFSLTWFPGCVFKRVFVPGAQAGSWILPNRGSRRISTWRSTNAAKLVKQALSCVFFYDPTSDRPPLLPYFVRQLCNHGSHICRHVQVLHTLRLPHHIATATQKQRNMLEVLWRLHPLWGQVRTFSM